MTRAPIKLLCSLAVAGLGAAAIAGCGNDVPTGAVAKVGDSVIKKADFERWLDTAAAGTQAGAQPASYEPPDHAECVASKRKQPAPDGQGKPSAAKLKRECAREYDQLKQSVMQFLIQAEWVQHEAEEQGIEVKEAEVKRSFEDQKEQAFPKEKDYKRFLETSGMTEEDILFRVRLDQLQQKLTQKVTEGENKVTDEEIGEYYAQNKERFAQPERRDLRVVLTRSKGKAEEAKAALDGGDSWKSVVNRYSIDEASKSQGGRLPAVAEGQQEQALDAAVFDAKRGEVSGPVKTQFGWYVFEVEKVQQASQQSLDESKETIRNLLRSQNQQQALDDFIKDFRERYKEMTVCAEDFEVAECENGPEPATTGPASGGAPQGQPQGGPQGGAPPPQVPQQ